MKTTASGNNYDALVAYNRNRRFDNSVVFVENSSYPRHRLKFRIIEGNMIPHKCECGIGSEWNGKKLSLQLDHKNGINNDNRIVNLRFLCPNCHSQQMTYAGKNKKNVLRVSKPGYNK